MHGKDGGLVEKKACTVNGGPLWGDAVVHVEIGVRPEVICKGDSQD